jgi:hypothetical protein
MIKKKSIHIDSHEAIKAAKRMAYLSGEVYIPKTLRKKIKIGIDKNGDVVIKMKKKHGKKYKKA